MYINWNAKIFKNLHHRFPGHPRSKTFSTTLHNLFSRIIRISQHQKGGIFLNFNEARDEGIGNGIRWTTCKLFSLYYRQTTMPALSDA